MSEPVEVVVVGAGQAGLAISYYLTQQGRTHVVLERETQVGSAWRHGRWDSFTLVIPNWAVRLPGFPYRGDDPDGFMERSEIVNHLERYASSFGAPARFGVTVTAVDPAPGGSGYLVSTSSGGTYAAANVVVATGSFQFPKPTKLAEAFPPSISQMHSSSYRNPDGLPPGAVLVVGSADTGCQIADELCEQGRQVYMCVGHSSRRPRRYRGRDVAFWVVTLGGFDQTADQLPDPGARFAANAHLTGKSGGYTLNLHQFARNGVVLLGHLFDAATAPLCSRQICVRIWPSLTRDQTISRTMSMRSFVKPAWMSQLRSPTRSMKFAPMLVKMPPRPLISRLPVSRA
jgi:putative flavoprotein involved in K+ transport